MADLNTDVRYIKGVGEAKAKALGKLGIATLGDLIAWFPHRCEDRRETKPVSQLIPGETACVAAMIAAEPKLSHIRKGMDLVKVRAVDDTGVLDVTFFNQPLLKNQLHVAITRADKNELAQVALRQELENAAKREAQREKTITRLLNENEDFRRWYGAGLPDAVRRLHQRPACTDASDCPQRLPESEPLPDAGQ